MPMDMNDGASYLEKLDAKAQERERAERARRLGNSEGGRMARRLGTPRLPRQDYG